jgi:hypothetical protein
VKRISSAGIAQFAIADQREKGLAGFLRSNLDDSLRPIMSGKESGIAVGERLKDIKGAFMRALRAAVFG